MNLLNSLKSQSAFLFGKSGNQKSLGLFSAVVLPWLLYFGYQVPTLWEKLGTVCTSYGDFPLILLNIERASRGGALIGPYSRFGFAHPGPVSFYWYALITALLPESFSAQGAAILAQFICNALFMLITCAILWRESRNKLLAPLTFVCALLAFNEMNNPFLLNIWNPVTTVFPSLTVLVTAAMVAEKKIKYLPVLALATIFATHSHLMVCIWLLPIAVLATIIGLVRAYNRDTFNSDTFNSNKLPWRSLLFAALISALGLFGPLYEAWIHDGGNIATIFNVAINTPKSVVRFGLLVAAQQFIRVYSFLLPEYPGLAAGAILFLPIVMRRRFDSVEKSLLVVSYIALGWGLLVLSNGNGKWYNYLLLWGYSLAGLHCAAALIILPRWLLLGVIVSMFSMVILKLPQSVILDSADPEMTCAAARIWESVAGQINLKEGELVKLEIRRGGFWPQAGAVSALLAKRGVHFCVARRWQFMFGPSSGCPRAADKVLVFEKINGNDEKNSNDKSSSEQTGTLSTVGQILHQDSVLRVTLFQNDLAHR